MNQELRAVVLYGHGVDAVAEALRDLDPRYVAADHVTLEPGQVPVLRRRLAAQADAARDAAPGIGWLVVELYRPGGDVGHARYPVLFLNTSLVDPGTAARAIDQPHLVIWYEIINPVRVTTTDTGPAAEDYSNITFIVPNGHRVIAHAVRAGGSAPECLPDDASQVLRSDDLWALARLRETEICQACIRRHG